MDSDKKYGSKYYKLIGKEVKEVSRCEILGLSESKGFIGTRVKWNNIKNIVISTVFLGIDHNCGEGPPLLFETMVFGGPDDEAIQRYSTYEEAEKGHDEMVQRVRDEIRKGKK